MISTDDVISIADTLCGIAVEAGKKVLAVYETDFSTDLKEDRTPITKADRESHRYILNHLKRVSLGGIGTLPVLSEEGKEIPFNERNDWNAFWLVDPLDGTKEFVKRNGEFTINIALIQENRPIAGFVYVPVSDALYFGIEGNGAYTSSGSAVLVPGSIIREARSLPLEETRSPRTIRVMASRSHFSSETETFIEKLKERLGDIDIISAGSSLKLCKVAEGSVDIYPRFGPTMEWDIAAAQAVCTASGCTVINPQTKTELRYNKKELVNPHFIVYRDPKFIEFLG